MDVRRVLCPTDFSPCATQALEAATLVARSFGAQLHVFHAIVLHEEDPHSPAHHLPDVAEMETILAGAAASRMAEDIAPHRRAALPIVEAQRRGPFAAPTILSYAAEVGADLIVMGSHGRRGIAHLLLGSVADEVVRRASCPVMVVPGHEDEPKLGAIERILVPLDFSEPSTAALAAARDLAVRWTARLQLLHVVEEQINPSFYAVGVTSLLQQRPEIRTASTAEMQRRLAEAGGGDADAFVVEGRAAREIVGFAADHATDLIVMATHGLSGWERLLLGSVAERVIRTAPCAVMVVRGGAQAGP
jgi:nucleotide-binding universal stress UspA family protein